MEIIYKVRNWSMNELSFEFPFVCFVYFVVSQQHA